MDHTIMRRIVGEVTNWSFVSELDRLVLWGLFDIPDWMVLTILCLLLLLTLFQLFTKLR